MKVLDFVQSAMGPLIDPTYDPRIFRYFTFIYLSSSLFIIVGSSYTISDNLKDFSKLPEPLYVVTTWTLGFIKFFSFIQHKSRIRDTFNRLQVIVDRST